MPAWIGMQVPVGQAMRRLRPRQEIRTGRMVSRQAIHTGTSRQMEHQQMKCRKMERRSIREHGILTCGGAGGIRHPGRIHAGTGRTRAGGCIQGRQTDRKAPDIQEAEIPVHEDNFSFDSGSGISEPREPATTKPDMPFREESARADSRRGSRNRREEAGQRAKQHGNKYQQRFQKEARAEEQAASGEAQKKPSKPEFTADELPPEKKDRKLSQAVKKAERTEQKLERAKERLPSRRKLRMETVSDPEAGKAKKRLKHNFSESQ